MTHAYKFANNPGVPVQPPVDTDTMLCDKAFTPAALSRSEKDRLARLLYGPFSEQSGTYRRAGWAWPLHRAAAMRRILVACAENPGAFRAYYAPDKTALRRALGRCRVEMIYAPARRAKET